MVYREVLLVCVRKCNESAARVEANACDRDAELG